MYKHVEALARAEMEGLKKAGGKHRFKKYLGHELPLITNRDVPSVLPRMATRFKSYGFFQNFLNI